MLLFQLILLANYSLFRYLLGSLIFLRILIVSAVSKLYPGLLMISTVQAKFKTVPYFFVQHIFECKDAIIVHCALVLVFIWNILLEFYKLLVFVLPLRELRFNHFDRSAGCPYYLKFINCIGIQFTSIV